jgi:SPP1 family predicted phage head-tail adaptor
MGQLNAGDLTQRVTFVIDAVSISDGRGGYVPAGPPLETTVWARVQSVKAGELVALGQKLGTEAVRVTVRTGPGVSRTTRQRVRWQGLDYQVQSVVADEAGEFIVFTAFTDGK